MLGLGPGETISIGETIASKGADSEIVSMEVLTIVPTALRLPRPKPTSIREVPGSKKDKKNKPMPVCESPRKHAATQVQRKEKLSVKEKGKVVDLEVEE